MKMVTFTVSIPAELKKEVDLFPEINFAEYLKKRFERRLEELNRFESSKADSKKRRK